MSLITCPDCKNQISDQAPVCLNCGRPITAAQKNPGQNISPGIQTIEATGKKWKLLQMVGVCVMVVGMVSCVGSVYSGSLLDPAHTAGNINRVFPVISWLGFFIIIAGRIGAWWHHR